MTHNYINIVGQIFGKLIVVEYAQNNRWGHSLWACQCDCGNEIIVSSNSLRKGNTKSCGCLVLKHGHSRKGRWSKIYRSWSHMVQRCTNQNNKRYCDYGGRGITVCKEWLKFENFLEDMGGNWEPGLTLDRTNNEKGYYKKNCRWATRKQQAGNKRNNLTITHKGVTQLITQWAGKLGVKYSTLRYRFCVLGWSAEKAITTPVRGQSKS